MNTKVVAIVLSAGVGKRMNQAIPKQYLKVNDKEILYYTLKAFEKSEVDEVVLVAGENDIEFCENNIVEKYNLKKVVKIVAGGSERYDSVNEGLISINDASYVLIHDGARPCIKSDDINAMIRMVKEKSACIMAVKAKDTIKIVENHKIVGSPDRNTMWQAQTPQAFEYNGIKEAYRHIISREDIKALKITDDASVWSLCEETPVSIYEGEYTNIKVTTIEDLELLKKYLK